VAVRSYTGISFPFRIGVKGGVVTSTTNVREVPHIIESMKQIVRTFRLERTMEPHIYSDIDTDIFEPNDLSTYTLIDYQLRDAFTRLEPRIEVLDIQFEGVESTVYATVTFKVIPYDSEFTARMKVGETSGNDSNP
jgi:phage baseplate assembly protein W